ncbi:MAG: hypothetical protein WCI05_07435 [Myxococcales bacterium]|jgi:hypothetical protein
MSPSARVLVAASFAAAVLLGAPEGKADEQGELEKARIAYRRKDYDDADKRFRVLLHPSTGTLRDTALIAEARMYWGAVHVARGQSERAAALFETLLFDRPDFEPDALRIAAEAMDLFIDVRSKLRDRLARQASRRAEEELERKRQRDRLRQLAAERTVLLEKMAGEQVLIVRHSRLVALVPFGVGQLQNGQAVLGWTLLAIQAAAVVAASTSFVVYRMQLSEASDAYARSDFLRADGWRSRAVDTRITNLASVGLLVGTAVAGILHAQLTFVAEHVEVRSRPIPPAVPSVVLVPVPEHQGMGLSLTVTF